jgi:hypothetical protein
MCRRYVLFFLMIFSSIFVVNANNSYGFAVNNFTLTDIEGNNYDLDQMMREGKHVILNFGTTWAPSSWNYEKTQTLSNINKLYQMDDKDKVVILFLETDLNTDVACINGSIDCNYSSMGNWAEMIDYPIINLTQDELDYLRNYKIDEYPTVYGIKPDRTISSLGQADMNRVVNWLEGTSIAMADMPSINVLDQMAKASLYQPLNFDEKVVSSTAVAPVIAVNFVKNISITADDYNYSNKFSDESTENVEGDLNILDLLALAELDSSWQNGSIASGR